MDKIFVRNCVLFFLALLVSTGGLVYTLVRGNNTITRVDDWVNHSQEIILESQRIATLVESMLATQRGYIITGNDDFFEKYMKTKSDMSERIARMSELLKDNPAQVSRINEIRNYFNGFTAKLEDRAQKYKKLKNIDDFIAQAESVNLEKENIISLNSALLRTEYGILDQRIHILQKQKSNYFNTLIVGVIFSGFMLLILNGFLLNAQRKRGFIEATLKDNEKRFALAMEGSRDGIFDWNIITGEVYYSAQFFNILGYDRKAGIGKLADAQDLLHPDDIEPSQIYVEKYLRGEMTEYIQEIRMKHTSGRWVWIQSRAKALYDQDGKPMRLIGAHTDITDVKNREAQLEAEKKSAEEANRAKSDFLAHMSHEIRTPLTAISGIAEIFEGHNNTNFTDKQKKLAHTLHTSSQILKDIVNDILDFSKIESGELELNEDKVNLRALFEEIISIMSVRTNEKAISFIVDYEEITGAEFLGDKTRIRQILINLVGNAIKFTNVGGVSVRAHKEERQGVDFLRVDITDTGPGIAAENFDLIFERFKQADASVSRKYGGTGLGLSISKNLAQLMGGSITLSSQLGKGSTFSLLLPFRACMIPSDRSDHIVHLEVARINDLIMSRKQEETKFLIAEDYEGNIVILEHMLDSLGIQYDVARNGKDAVAAYAKSSYSLILMDVQMPEMDGFMATTQIREIESINQRVRTPILGMTAHALVVDKDRCIAVGMDAYMSKPIDEIELKKYIYRFISPPRLKIA